MSVRLCLLLALVVGCVGGLECYKCENCKKTAKVTETETCEMGDSACRIIYDSSTDLVTRGCAMSCASGNRMPKCGDDAQGTLCCCDTDKCNCKQDETAICKPPPPPTTTTAGPPLTCWNAKKNREDECKVGGPGWCYNQFDSSGKVTFSGCELSVHFCTKNTTADKCVTSLITTTCCCRGDLCNKKDKCQCKGGGGGGGGGGTKPPGGGGSRPDTKTTATALLHLFALAVFYFN